MANKYKNKTKAKDILDPKLVMDFGRDYVRILIALLKKAGKVATGSLINSISPKLYQTADDIRLLIEANDYLTYVDEGRKPGSYPPIQAISRWASTKGISQSVVFPIARSIFKHGIKPTNVIQLTTREFETSPTLTNKYEDIISKRIEDTILKDYIDTLENN
tara:strand:+ start:1247 stop:1732 length:486 start_codon:yes stop_codon:yes gene_type:complete